MTRLASFLLLALSAAPAAAQDAWVAEARQVATSVPPKLLSVLTTEIERSGPAGAIGQIRGAMTISKALP